MNRGGNQPRTMTIARVGPRWVALGGEHFAFWSVNYSEICLSTTRHVVREKHDATASFVSHGVNILSRISYSAGFLAHLPRRPLSPRSDHRAAASLRVPQREHHSTLARRLIVRVLLSSERRRPGDETAFRGRANDHSTDRARFFPDFSPPPEASYVAPLVVRFPTMQLTPENYEIVVVWIVRRPCLHLVLRLIYG